MRPRESVHPVASADDLARAGAEIVLAHARAALDTRGTFHLALAGGSTPRGLYRELARRADASTLAGAHAWFGDERCVAPEHADSNYRMVSESGILACFHARQVHRMRGETPDPEAEAARYERELCAELGPVPRLDLVLLGLGPDGHTLSLFPGTPALEAEGWVTVGRAPLPPVARLSLTLATLEQARALVFLVSGSDKAPALAAALDDSVTPALPARRARPLDGTLLWMVECRPCG
ncbi:MAG: 6-phosphogluconolactonase [Planctomycetes bacterium]|nr:6-phosphogluconolactonase [Planctomycetota bacterium]